MARLTNSSGFDSCGSSFNSPVAAQQLLDRSQSLCGLVDQVPILGRRLLTAPVSIGSNDDYDKLLSTNQEVISFILSAAELFTVCCSSCCSGFFLQHVLLFSTMAPVSRRLLVLPRRVTRSPSTHQLSVLCPPLATP